MLTPADLQARLNDSGFDAGPSDGIMGPRTRAAIDTWFRSGLNLDAPQPTVQHMSERGIRDLVLSEGLRTTAYQDSVGVWTIGVGHAATSGRSPIPKAGMTITKQEAMDILAADLAEEYEPAVRRELGAVPQHVFDGAVSFHFNTGSIEKASWVAAYKAGDMVDAERRFMAWKHPPEIISRRKREADLIFRGKYAT